MAVSVTDVLLGVVAPDGTGFPQNLSWNAAGSGSQAVVVAGVTNTPGGNTFKNHE